MNDKKRSMMLFFYLVTLFYCACAEEASQNVKNSTIIITNPISIIHTPQFLQKFHSLIPPQPQSQSPQKQLNLTSYLTNFQQTLSTFPHLLQNFNPTIMTELYDEKACFHSGLRWPIGIFGVVEGRGYYFGEFGKKYRNGNKRKSKDGLVMFERYLERLEIYEKYLARITAKMSIPDVYFFVEMSDVNKEQFSLPGKKYACQSMPLFAFNKNISSDYQKSRFLLPDAYITNKWSPQVGGTKQLSQQIPLAHKKSKLYFRGIASGPHFQDIHLTEQTSNWTIMKYYHRGGFVMLSFLFPELIDARFNLRSSFTDFIDKRMGRNKSQVVITAPKDEQLQNKYLLSADGFGAAWKRVPWILFSNSVLFKPKSDVMQWFYGKMEPGRHYVEVKEDLSDIFGLMEELEGDEGKVLEIVKNANALAQEYLTSQAIQKFGGEQLIKFAGIQKLHLTPNQKQYIKKGGQLPQILRQRRKQQLKNLDNFFILKWNKIWQLNSFQDIFTTFPEFSKNVNVNTLVRIVEERRCGERYIGVLIINGKVYMHGYDGKNEMIRLFSEFLVQAAKKQQLMDMYIILQTDNDQQQSEYSSENCTSIPIFALSKNISSLIEKRRFLLPDFRLALPDQQFSLNDTWLGNNSFPQQQKINKAFFISTSEKGQKSQTAKLQQLSVLRPDLLEPISNPYNNPDKSNPIHIYSSYKYTIITKDTPFSSHHLKLSLYTDTIVLRTLPEKIYWFDQKLVPNVHFLPVAEDFGDLGSKIRKYQQNRNFVRGILEEGRVVAQRYFTKDALYRQTAIILNKFASIQKLNLSLAQSQNQDSFFNMVIKNKMSQQNKKKLQISQSVQQNTTKNEQKVQIVQQKIQKLSQKQKLLQQFQKLQIIFIICVMIAMIIVIVRLCILIVTMKKRKDEYRDLQKYVRQQVTIQVSKTQNSFTDPTFVQIQ